VREKIIVKVSVLISYATGLQHVLVSRSQRRAATRLDTSFASSVAVERLLEVDFMAATLLGTFQQQCSCRNLHTRARCIPWNWGSRFDSSLALCRLVTPKPASCFKLATWHILM
jgi:hypothetical protein